MADKPIPGTATPELSEGARQQGGGKGISVAALARGFLILRCFDARHPELGTSEIARLTGLPQPTVWRLCSTLVELGCLVRRRGSDKLGIGLGLLGYGYSALPTLDLGELAKSEMQRLADEFRAGVSLCFPDKLEMLIVERVRGVGGLLSRGQIGSRLPIATSAAGWAYLSALPEAAMAAAVAKLRSQYRGDWPALWNTISEELRRRADHGFIINSGVYRPEINYAAVPIVLADDCIYTLHCSGLASVLPIRLLEEQAGPRLVDLAARIRITLAASGPLQSQRTSGRP